MLCFGLVRFVRCVEQVEQRNGRTTAVPLCGIHRQNCLIRENREAVKRDNNNIFDFMESEGYIRCKADASISSKDFYEIYRMWCEENSLAPLKARSFSDAMIANAKKFNLEHCNNITNSAGRRVWGFMGVEAIARPHINGFYGDSPCTYVPEDIPEEWRQVE